MLRIVLALILVLIVGGNAQSQVDTLQPFNVPQNGKQVAAVFAQSPTGLVLVVWLPDGKLVLLPVGESFNPSPDVLTGLSKDVYDWTKSLVPSTSYNQAKALAAAYRSTADKIRKGEVKTIADVMAAQTAANRAALGLTAETANASPWKPFIVKLAGYLTEQGLTDPKAPADPMAAINDSIARGLEALP